MLSIENPRTRKRLSSTQIKLSFEIVYETFQGDFNLIINCWFGQHPPSLPLSPPFLPSHFPLRSFSLWVLTSHLRPGLVLNLCITVFISRGWFQYLFFLIVSLPVCLSPCLQKIFAYLIMHNKLHFKLLVLLSNNLYLWTDTNKSEVLTPSLGPP